MIGFHWPGADQQCVESLSPVLDLCDGFGEQFAHQMPYLGF